jgi:hypothetical protein
MIMNENESVTSFNGKVSQNCSLCLTDQELTSDTRTEVAWLDLPHGGIYIGPRLDHLVNERHEWRHGQVVIFHHMLG